MSLTIEFYGVCIFDVQDGESVRVLLPQAREPTKHPTGDAAAHYGYLFIPAEDFVGQPDVSFEFPAGREWGAFLLGVNQCTEVAVGGGAGSNQVGELTDPAKGLPNLRSLAPNTSLRVDDETCAGEIKLPAGRFTALQGDGGLPGGTWDVGGDERATLVHAIRWTSSGTVGGVRIEPGRDIGLHDGAEARVYCVEVGIAKDVFAFERHGCLGADTCLDHDFKWLYRMLSGGLPNPLPFPKWTRDRALIEATPRTPQGLRTPSLPTCFPGGWW